MKNLFKIKNKKEGFSIIEVIIVISIISILFIILIPKFGFAPNKAKDSGVITDFRAIQTALIYFESMNHTLPNINQINETLDGDFRFEIKKAYITEQDSKKFLVIRGESISLSPYKCPYGVNLICLYTGTEDSGYEYILPNEVTETYLSRIDSDSIVFITIDCIYSDIEEIIIIK